jgi:ribosomal protein S6--L-glutamate ligase
LFVIDGKVVATINAKPCRQFRANIHLGGTASVIKITAEKRIAIKAAKAMDLKVAGVDIILLQRTFVAGSKSSPGLGNIGRSYIKI